MTSTGPSEHIGTWGLLPTKFCQCPHQNSGNSGSPAQMIFYYILAPSNFLSFCRFWECSTSNKTSYLINFSLWTYTSRSWHFLKSYFLFYTKMIFSYDDNFAYLLFAFFFKPTWFDYLFFVTLNEKINWWFSTLYTPVLVLFLVYLFLFYFFQRQKYWGRCYKLLNYFKIEINSCI